MKPASLSGITYLPRVRAASDAARADYLVTGNLRHFPRFWKKTKIITPREFIGLVAPHLITYAAPRRRVRAMYFRGEAYVTAQ